MSSFPEQDSYWVDTANFVAAHRHPAESLLAPAAFRERLEAIDAYSLHLETVDRFLWAIVHKGNLEALPCKLLRSIVRRFKPVFANEVFVVFTRRSALPAIDRSSPHLKAFREGLKAYQRKVGRSFSLRISNLKFEFSIKPDTNLHQLASSGSQPVATSKADTSETANISEAFASLPPSIGSRELIYLGDHKALTRTVWGHKMFVNTRDMSLTPHILLDGYWEMWITKFFISVLQEGMIVVDVGANIGYYTLLAAAQVGSAGKVYAFEANPQVFETLTQNVEINGFRDRTDSINKAAYSHFTNLKFRRFQTHHGSSTIRNLPEGFAEEYQDHLETIEVAAISLDEYFRQGTKIDLIKMDAEGSEIFIFRGMKNIIKNNPQLKIIFEFCPKFILEAGEEPRAFLESLQRSGFKIQEITEASEIVDISVNQLIEEPKYRELFIFR
jgi:FkbM family methyltransferase